MPDIKKLLNLEVQMLGAKKKLDAAETKRAASVKALQKATVANAEKAMLATDKACEACRMAFDAYEMAFRKFRDELTSK